MPPTHSKRPAGAQGRSSKPSSSKRLSGYGLPKAKSVQIQDDDSEEESCRKRDKDKSLSPSSTPTNQSPPLTPLQSVCSMEDLPARDIIPQRSPTAVTPNRYSYSELSEDSLQLSEDDRRRSRTNPQDSEAARYLRSFFSSDALSQMTSRTPRPRYNRSSTSIAGLSTAPSLSDSPSSADALTMPYTPSSRPLPSRYNPFSSSSYGNKSADLVNPYAIIPPLTPSTPSSSPSRTHPFKLPPVTAQSTEVAKGDVTYEKRDPIPPSSPTHASLKRMFHLSDMQAPPSYSET